MTLAQIGSLVKKGVPYAFSLMGLKKVNPRMKNFVTSALAGGFSGDQIVSYLRDKLEPEGARMQEQSIRQQGMNARPDQLASLATRQQQAAPLQALGALGGAGAALMGMGGGQEPEQGQQTMSQGMDQQAASSQGYAISPLEQLRSVDEEVANFFEQGLNEGKMPMVLAWIAKNSKGLQKNVSKIERQAKKNFVDFVSEIFGGQGQQSTQSPMQTPSQMQQAESPMQGGGGNQQAIMAALDKIMQM